MRVNPSQNLQPKTTVRLSVQNSINSRVIRRILCWLTSALVVASVLCSTAPVTARANGNGSDLETIYFTANSSALTTSAKSTLRNLKRKALPASVLTITGYAPKTPSSARQTQLARARASATKAYLKRVGIRNSATTKFVLLKVGVGNQKLANRVTIKILQRNLVPSPSPSPTTTATATPSPSPTNTPSLEVSGRVTLNFVDCNPWHRQVLGTSLTFQPSDSNESPISVSLGDVNTSSTNNNLMNCTISWSGVSLPVGEYNLTIAAKCFEILDSETSANSACTPNKYSYYDLNLGQSKFLTGTGPTSIEGGVAMTINFPTKILQSGESSLSAYLD
ncbi:MAG: hypothetical protein EBS36_03800 [Actinobacteria bacterium]|nr:hypothetical protein [Actinomycetota bacterium]NBY15679.1 hypothetical protein [Actinomycetota bacterium]